MSKKSWSVGVDLGGTKLIVALVDSEGTVSSRIRVATRVKEGPKAIISDIADSVKQLRADVDGEILGVGIGIAGQIEKGTGVVHFAPNLQWHGVPLQSELQRALGIDVVVINDVRAATWGEWMHGAGKGTEDLLCLFVGTGIGGGIVSGGKLLVGSTNAAGEIGHMPIDFHGPKCTCGGRGCFEAFAGGWAIARRAKELISEDHAGGQPLIQLAGGDVNLVSAKTVFEAAGKKIPLGILLVEEIKEAMIAGVTGLVNAFNPKCLVMGGGVIEGMPELVSFVKEGVFKNALTASTEELQIVRSKLHNEAGVIGAASVAIQTKEKK